MAGPPRPPDPELNLPWPASGFKPEVEPRTELAGSKRGDLEGAAVQLVYFLPHEGTNNVAWGLIAFDNLASYEAYRARLRADPEGQENFAMALAQRLILREERTFVEVVEGTLARWVA